MLVNQNCVLQSHPLLPARLNAWPPAKKYDPCHWKDEGAACTICDPADKSCKEPAAGKAVTGCDGQFPDWRAGNAHGRSARTVCEKVSFAGTSTVQFQYKYVVGQYAYSVCAVDPGLDPGFRRAATTRSARSCPGADPDVDGPLADDVRCRRVCEARVPTLPQTGYCGKKGMGIGPTLSLTIGGKEHWKKQVRRPCR